MMAGKYIRNKHTKSRAADQSESSPKPKKHTGRIILLSILLLLLLAAGAVAAFIWTKLDLIQYDHEVDYNVYNTVPTQAQGGSTTAAEADPDEQIVDISGLEIIETAPVIPDSEAYGTSNVQNILIIGTDERTKDFSANARSDCMILVSIDKEKNTVKLVSLERGMAAPVLEGVYQGQYDWLTHIFRYGGAELLRKTVEYCFKVDVGHYVRFNFTSVKSIIDTIGGVDIELTSQEAQGLNGSTGTKFHAGVNHMDGEAALSYARLRSIDSDWQRVERQRKVILAVVAALKGSSLLELNTLADEVLPMVQTNLSKLEIAELILYAPNFLNASFDQLTIPKAGTYGGMTVMGGRGAFAVDFEINNDLLYRFLYEGATSQELLAE